MSEQAPQAKSYEERLKEYPEGSLSTYTDSLLADKDRDPEDIIDRYIGAMLATQGAAEGATILYDIDKNSNKADWPKMFTRKDGLRRAIVTIGLDERTASAIGVMYARLNGSLEEPVMTNTNQLAGYLDAFEADESILHDSDKVISWKRIIADELTKYFSIPHRAEAWKTRGNLESEVPSVRSNQQEWERAVTIAKKLGFDIGTLTRSAEYTRERSLRMKKELGEVSLSDDKYDRLFDKKL
jgi:hypothetical protein